MSNHSDRTHSVKSLHAQGLSRPFFSRAFFLLPTFEACLFAALELIARRIRCADVSLHVNDFE